MLKKILVALILIVPMNVAAQTLKFGHFRDFSLADTPEYLAFDAKKNELTRDYFQMYNQLKKEYEEALYSLVDRSHPSFQILYQQQQNNIARLETQMMRLTDEFHEEIRVTEERVFEAVKAKYKKAIQDIGTAEGFIFIFDISQGNVPFVDESQSVDITKRIKEKMGIK